MQRPDLFISALTQMGVVLVVALLPIGVDINALRRLMRPPVTDGRSTWNRRAAYLAVASSFFVYVLPIVLLIHNIVGRRFWDFDPIFAAMTVWFVLSMAIALIAPGDVRAQVIIGALIPYVFWLIFPTRGIL